MNALFGHNETTVRLGLLADDARSALKRVASGEENTLEGWLAYGAALNEGRKLHPSDELFGQWLVSNNLLHTDGDEVNRPIRAAAIWANEYPDQYERACAAGNSKTIRGIYAKWNEIDAERVATEARAMAEAERAKAEAERRVADEARRTAEADRREAKARADAEAEAIAAVKRAKDDEQRRIAQAQAASAARARAEAEARAKAEDDRAKASERLAKASDKAAKTADNSAKAADKKAARASQGNTSSYVAPNHQAIGTGENEWYTPAEFAEMARLVMGGIDLDPASNPVANETIKATRYFTKEDDGLARDWSGRLWLNPPYSQGLMLPFCEKLAAHFDAGDVTAAILVSHNNTDTRWFHRLGKSCAAISFPKNRIRFYRGEEIAAPTSGQCFFYFGNDVAKFTEVFGKIGMVVLPQ
jgi:hypothetical protein